MRDSLLRASPAVDAPSRSVNSNFDKVEFRKCEYRECCINVDGCTHKACDSGDDVPGVLFGTPSLDVCSDPKLVVRYRNCSNNFDGLQIREIALTTNRGAPVASAWAIVISSTIDRVCSEISGLVTVVKRYVGVVVEIKIRCKLNDIE